MTGIPTWAWCGAGQAYIWEDKVFRSDFVGARLTRNNISVADLEAKIAGAPAGRA